jgi:hypothetical protein
LALFLENKRQRQVFGVASDKSETKPNKSYADEILAVIYSLNETRRLALRLNDSLLLHSLDMATLQVSETLGSHVGFDKKHRI